MKTLIEKYEVTTGLWKGFKNAMLYGALPAALLPLFLEYFPEGSPALLITTGVIALLFNLAKFNGWIDYKNYLN